MPVSFNDRSLFLLINSTLWKTKLPIAAYEHVSDNDWEYLYRQARKQGLTGLVYDAISSLPTQQLPRNLHLRWVAHVEAIEERYHQQQHALEKLGALYRQHDIRILLLKGIGLSTMYPFPSHREGGDIDVYLFGDYEKANRIMEKNGIDVNTVISINPKHAIFYVKGIPVENHRYFLNIDHAFKSNRILQDQLFNILKTHPCESLQVGEETIYLPPPMFNAYYLIMHIITHLAGFGVVLRHLCDWTIFLKTYHDTLDFKELKDVLADAGYLKAVNLLTTLCVHHLDLAVDHAGPFYTSSNKSEDKLLQKAILHPRYEDVSNIKHPLKVVYIKTARSIEHMKINILLHGYRFALTYLFAILGKRIKQPQKIFRFSTK